MQATPVLSPSGQEAIARRIASLKEKSLRDFYRKTADTVLLGLATTALALTPLTLPVAVMLAAIGAGTVTEGFSAISEGFNQITLREQEKELGREDFIPRLGRVRDQLIKGRGESYGKLAAGLLLATVIAAAKVVFPPLDALAPIAPFVPVSPLTLIEGMGALQAVFMGLAYAVVRKSSFTASDLYHEARVIIEEEDNTAQQATLNRTAPALQSGAGQKFNGAVNAPANDGVKTERVPVQQKLRL